MTLEDFFTLTEMSTGLTTPSRVQELVSKMQKEKDCAVKKTGEITRQWSAVASTIAATENKECLELFSQLDGLCFIESWLNDALRFSSETSDSFAEESMTHLLRAVERLHVDNKKVSSGIRVIVNSLLGHTSSKVQERAKALFDSWDKEKDNDAVSVSVDKVHMVEKGLSESSPGDISLSGRGCGEEKCEEYVSDNKMPSSRSDDIDPSMVCDIKTSDRDLELTKIKDALPTSTLAKSITEDHKVEHSTYNAEGATNAIDACTSAVSRLGAHNDQTDGHDPDSVNYLNQKVRSSENFNSAATRPLEITISSGPDARDDAGEASDAVTGPDLQRQTDVNGKDNCGEKSSFDDALVVVPDGKTSIDDSGPENHGRSNRIFVAKEDRKYNTGILQDSSKHNLEHPNDWRTILSKVDVTGGANPQNETEDDMENDTEIEEQEEGGKGCDVIDKKSDIELDYNIMDPLEVARQVAIEVEREVEQSCSSSEKIEESKVHEPDSSNSVSAKQCQYVEGSNKEVPRGLALLTEASLSNSEARPINGTDKLENSQVTDASLDLEVNSEKSLCKFDLNLEVCSDDVDLPGNPISTSISVVSASRAAAAPGAPAAPLQFEGTLGWKGSAATSAFRPASPRHSSCLDIDLNVTEGGDDRPAGVLSEIQVPVSSAFLSGESSFEASPKKLGRLDWDLNCASEEGEEPSESRMEGRFFSLRNDHPCQSPSSSSSSKQTLVRNFDLNDRLNDISDLPNFRKPSQDLNASGRIKSGDSVVSIMGMKVEVDRKDFALHSFPFPNGRIAENAVDLNVARSGSVLGMGSPFTYNHSPAFGYNAIAPGPVTPFSSSMYGPSGPITYMVDSGGSPVVPQLFGSASAIPPSFSQQPFFIGMAGPPPVPNGVGPSRSGFDLNTGLVLEGGNRDLGGLRQFFAQGQARSLDEHLRNGSQPSTSSSIGGKRKEADGGWEPYPFKHHQPPWK